METLQIKHLEGLKLVFIGSDKNPQKMLERSYSKANAISILKAKMKKMRIYEDYELNARMKVMNKM